MIINSFQLSGNEPTLADLTKAVNAGDYDFHISSNGCVVLTKDAGLVRIGTDKAITANIAISFDDTINESEIKRIDGEVKANVKAISAVSADVDKLKQDISAKADVDAFATFKSYTESALTKLNSDYRFIKTETVVDEVNSASISLVNMKLLDVIAYINCAALSEGSASLKVTVNFVTGTAKIVILPDILSTQQSNSRYKFSIRNGIFEGRVAIQFGDDTGLVDEKLCNATLAGGSYTDIKSIDFNVVADGINIPVGTTITVYGR